MRIIYLDLSLSIIESQSIYPTRYGGGSAFSKYCKEFPNFCIYAKNECYNDLTSQDNKSNCKIIVQEQIDKLLNNVPIEEVIPEIKDYDILCHCTPNIYINTDNIKKLSSFLGLWATMSKFMKNTNIYYCTMTFKHL